MHWLDLYALPAVVIASTLGALLLSALAWNGGMANGDEERGRLAFIRRLAHAAVAFCFAVATMLSVVALAARPVTRIIPRPTPTESTAVLEQALRGLAVENGRVAEEVRMFRTEVLEQLRGVETRI